MKLLCKKSFKTSLIETINNHEIQLDPYKYVKVKKNDLYEIYNNYFYMVYLKNNKNEKICMNITQINGSDWEYIWDYFYTEKETISFIYNI